MVSIYLIEDINDLKYVGSTTQKLNVRLCGHRSSKNYGRADCSSSKLNLYNCIIILLEQCNLEDRKERERYWINEIDCVNKNKLNGRDKEKDKEYRKEWHEKNKEKINERNREYSKKYYQKNKEKLNKKHREYRRRKKAGH